MSEKKKKIIYTYYIYDDEIFRISNLPGDTPKKVWPFLRALQAMGQKIRLLELADLIWKISPPNKEKKQEIYPSKKEKPRSSGY